mgnify:FL=1|jgi:hypothetical protein|tara:strand:- start:1642 stop:2301 length:660 start_codon:yes stop_codon:yes gene_type:complete
MNYLEFPRFTINLLPDKNFREIILNFYKENDDLKKDHMPMSKHDLSVTLKAPFYIDHLDNEEKLISSFLNLKKEIDIPNIINFNKLSYELINHNSHFRLELEKNTAFDFFSNQIIRRYDEFRKVLNPNDFQKDISRFGKLTESQILNYQIWGYPYLFKGHSHHIFILDLLYEDQKNSEKLFSDLKIILQNHGTLNLAKIAICKQSCENEAFNIISSIDL